MLKSRFQGAMVGAVVGDCLGAYWETRPWRGTHPLDQVTAKIEEQVRGGVISAIKYTDDSVLTLAVARSLVACRGLEQSHLAKSLCEAYLSNSERGFSSSTARVFTNIRDNGYHDIFSPAIQQFEGRGSCGNGGAMRISPVALYGYKEEATLVEASLQCTRLTHCHVSGLNGALLQSLAVRQALIAPQELAPLHFIDTLLGKIGQFETNFDSSLPPPGSDKPSGTAQSRRSTSSYRRTSEVNWEADLVVQFTGGQPSYTSQLQRIRAFLSQPQLPPPLTVQKQLGHGVLACEAVPCAIYSFLVAQRFDELIPFAISLGGDTDTIASMAGAIGGAYWGIEAIPAQWVDSCEGTREAIDLANSLHSLAL